MLADQGSEKIFEKKPIRETPIQVWGRVLLVVALIGFMGAYFWVSYKGEHSQILIQEKMLSQHDDLFGIYHGTAGEAWAVGKYGIILHTKDGGRNWKEQVSGTVQPLSAVSFIDNQTGFTVGNEGIILKTQDGGLSWKTQSSGVKDYLVGVQALDKDKAYAVGGFGTFLSTSDGGTTWVKHKFSWEKLIPQIIEQMLEVEPNLNAVCFVNPEVGWVVGEFGLILHTTDGGRNWNLQRGSNDLAQLFAVMFRDERRGWALGQRGTLVWTKDGGQHWLPSKVATERSLYAASLKGESMMVVGDRISLETKDGGSTWTKRDFGEHVVFTGVALTSNSAIVVGQGGLVRQIE